MLASACGVLAATLGPARCATLARARSGGAGGDARPSPQWCAALAATLGLALPACSRRQRGSAQPAECGACGDSRRSSPSPSLARARVGGAGLYGAGRNARSGYTLPSQPAAVARDDARHARDRGAGGDARRWELTVALPGLRPQRRWRGEPATFGVALPACSGGGDARPSPRLRRWRQRSTHQLAVALPGPRPQRRRWRRRSAQLAVALPGPHPQRRRWRGDARCRPPRLGAAAAATLGPARDCGAGGDVSATLSSSPSPSRPRLHSGGGGARPSSRLRHRRRLGGLPARPPRPAPAALHGAGSNARRVSSPVLPPVLPSVCAAPCLSCHLYCSASCFLPSVCAAPCCSALYPVSLVTVWLAAFKTQELQPCSRPPRG